MGHNRRSRCPTFGSQLGESSAEHQRRQQHRLDVERENNVDGKGNDTVRRLVIIAFLLFAPSVFSQAPPAPSNLTCTNGSGNDITLSWTDNSSSETSFKIERKLGISGTYAH